jgi:hypothetical protein
VNWLISEYSKGWKVRRKSKYQSLKIKITNCKNIYKRSKMSDKEKPAGGERGLRDIALKIMTITESVPIFVFF